MNETTIISEDECNIVLRKLKSVRSGIGKIPRNPYSYEIDPYSADRFQVNKFLEAFDLVYLQSGYVLDYGYDFLKGGSRPIVFTRNSASEPVTDHQRFDEAVPDKRSKSLIKHIKFEKTPSGYFQFALFSVFVHLFYLNQHAVNMDRKFIPSNSELQLQVDPLRFGRWVIDADKCTDILLQLDFLPQVTMLESDLAKVSTVMFAHSRGLIYQHQHIRWPNESKKNDDVVILIYDRGYMI